MNATSERLRRREDGGEVGNLEHWVNDSVWIDSDIDFETSGSTYREEAQDGAQAGCKRQWHRKQTCDRPERLAGHPVGCGSVVDLARWG